MNTQAAVLLVTEAKRENFGRGLWNGFKTIPLAIWHAIPFHHPHNAYHWGYLLGMVVFLALVVAVVHRRWT